MRAAPSELVSLGCDPAAFRLATADEWHGPCPRCSGQDRFRIHTRRPFPHWYCICRQCGFKGWADQLNESLKTPLTPEQRARFAEQQQLKEKDRVERIARRLSEVTTAELWAELHRRMADSQRAQWRQWGIPDEWQDYLNLGYTAHYSATIPTPAYTIPYFHNATPKPAFATMQYRLVDPPNPADRYRFEYGLPATYYETTPTIPTTDLAIICEGAKKAINLKVHGKPAAKTSVLAVPSKSAWGGIENAVKDCRRVFVMLDPDGATEARELALAIGPQARIVSLHVKIDDALLNGWITPDELRSAFRWAEKVTA